MARISTPLRFRSKSSFGLAGVLDDGCQIFYHTLFHTRQVGRITDLLVARFQQAGIDEGRFRSLLAVGLFHRLSTTMKEGGEPAILEVGIDARFVGIGLSFDAARGIDESSIERVRKGQPRTDADWVLCQWNQWADYLIVRYQANSKRFEMIALMDLKSVTGIDDRWGDLSQRIQFIDLGLQLDTEAKAGSYIELGDLEYAKLLQDEVSLLGKNVSTGEYMQTVTGQPSQREAILSISGTGVDVGPDQSTFEIKAQPTTEPEPTFGEGPGANSADAIDQTFRMRQKVQKSAWHRVTRMVKNLFGVSESLGGEGEELIREIETDDSESGAPRSVKSLRRKKISRAEGLAFEPTGDSEPTVEPERQEEVLSEELKQELETVSTPAELNEIDNSMERLELQATKFREEIKSGRAKEILDGMMGELTVQKAKLREASRQMQLQMAKKELVLKSERLTMQETLRRNEMTIRQKEAALANTKEQLANMSANLDRARQSSTSGNTDAQWKKKFEHALEETERLRAENEVIKKKLEAARVTQSSGRDKSAVQIELGALKEKYTRMVRQVEDLKRQNMAMMEKVRADRTASPKTDAQRIKMEQAVRLANERKIESDQLRERVTKMEQEELRLKRKIQELRNQVTQAQQNAAKKSGAA